MKTISKKVIAREIRKEHKLGRDFASINYSHYFNLMINTEDSSIWSDVFINRNSWYEYRSESVQMLCHNCEYDYSDNPTITSINNGYIADAIKKLQAAGWTITE